VTPVPDFPYVDTPYGRRGPYWSCDRDSAGNGIHTGCDFGAPVGARVVAARPGRLVHCDHGSAFGRHQVEVRCTDGTRDFYAHMCDREPEGEVATGDLVGLVGAEGNVTGPHLHFERHATSSGGWSCSVVRDPQPSIDWEDHMTEDDWHRLEDLVRRVVWDEKMKVTQPNGDEQSKAREQVLRETYQTVKRID
jgi:murein DD-endopeptidase MepM/ murein hydrolase activator NlpD